MLKQDNVNRIDNFMKKGSRHTKEQREKISKNRKGIASFAGKRHSEETKKRISIIKKEQGIVPRSAFKKGIVPWNKNLKNVMVPWNKGIPQDEKTKQKISKKLKGRKISLTVRKNMSLGQQKRWQCPQEKERMLKKFQEFFKTKKETSIEKLTRLTLEKYNINYKSQFFISGTTIDFYLPDYNIALYCDGDYWHSLPMVRERDKYFEKILKAKKIKIVRFTGTEIYQNIDALIKKIKTG